MEQHGRELDNWDTLVEKVIDSLPLFFILKDKNLHCLWGNHSTYTAVAMFQASATQDTWDKLFVF